MDFYQQNKGPNIISFVIEAHIAYKGCAYKKECTLTIVN